MMNERFAADVDSGQLFYSVSAAAAATLVGLVFVALSLNPSVMADTEPTGLRERAGQTFSSFIRVLVVSRVMLIPNPGRLGLGVSLVAIEVQGLSLTLRRMRHVRHDPDSRWRAAHA